MSDFRVNLDLAAVERALNAGMTEGAADGMDHVLDVSNQRAPRETGKLIASGHVVPGDTPGTSSVAYDADYAAIVHERLDVSHPTGQPKFLESAMASEAAQVGEIVAARMRKHL